MQLLEEMGVYEPSLLQILIDINQWEDSHRHEMLTVSGRDLYFKIAATLLEDSAAKNRPLKFLNGRTTDRATRNRIREFQKLGLVEVVDCQEDARTKRVVPTDKFITRLNLHLRLFKHLCHTRFLMVDKR